VEDFTRRLIEERLRDCRQALLGQSSIPVEGAEEENPLDALWRRVARRQLRDIDLALSRLPAPGYGVCEQCGEPIPPQRLYTVPWANKCFRCQTSLPDEAASLRRCGVILYCWY